jgi:hypothetical protein
MRAFSSEVGAGSREEAVSVAALLNLSRLRGRSLREARRVGEIYPPVSFAEAPPPQPSPASGRGSALPPLQQLIKLQRYLIHPVASADAISGRPLRRAKAAIAS